MQLVITVVTGSFQAISFVGSRILPQPILRFLQREHRRILQVCFLCNPQLLSTSAPQTCFDITSSHALFIHVKARQSNYSREFKGGIH